MAHFALVENNLVVKVIVAEQEYINTLEGTWVQTSYNTRGGIHYQPDTNTPSEDQSKALRKTLQVLEILMTLQEMLFINQNLLIHGC